MAGRTDRKPINLSPAVKARFNEFKAALEREEGRAATHDEIIGALLQGVPLWQADLMIRAYMRHPLGDPRDVSTTTEAQTGSELQEAQEEEDN